MTTLEFVESIADFSRLNFAEQIKRFCWHIVVQQHKARFRGADVTACFDETGCPKPSSVGPFLTSLADRKPPFLLKRQGAFELSRHARESFDALLGRREATIAVDRLLQELPAKLTVEPQRIYLEEALTCFRHGAFRAAIVMTWNLAYDHLCNVILMSPTKHSDFNGQLPKSFPKAAVSRVSIRDDFESLKESEVLQVAKSANVISGNVHKILKEKLDRRNIAAHPSNVSISRLTAEEFILDLVQNVALKF